MATLKDIAALCGLSVATVSKALNNMPDVGASTAERVRKVADELRYQPNAAARTMKTGRTMNIALLIYLEGRTIWEHPYFSGIASGIQDVLDEEGYDLTVINRSSAGAMDGFVDYCRYRNYDGVIVLGGGRADPAVRELTTSGIPLVTLDYEYDGHPAVLSDNQQGMRDLLEYVVSRGHRRIAFIHGEDTAVTRTRISTLRTFLSEKQIAFPDAWLVGSRYLSIEETGRRALELMAGAERPSCIFCPDDYAAIGAIGALAGSGLRVPEDVSIVGYDGLDLAELMRPKLTTMAQDSRSIGSACARAMLERLTGNGGPIRRIFIPGRLQPGATVRYLPDH